MNRFLWMSLLFSKGHKDSALNYICVKFSIDDMWARCWTVALMVLGQFSDICGPWWYVSMNENIEVNALWLFSAKWAVFQLHVYYDENKLILNPLPMVFWSSLPMVFWPSYPWYFEPLPMVFWPPTHCILNPLSMAYQTSYPWYFDPLSMVYWTPYT